MNSITNKNIAVGRFAVKLINNALGNPSVNSIPDGMSWREVYNFCKAQAISGMVYSCLSSFSVPADVFLCFYEDYKESIVRNASFDAITENVLLSLDADCIAAMPLKGYAVKHFYPEVYMRTSADVDVLFDTKDIKKLDAAMTKLGFTKRADSYDVVEYVKPPMFSFEMHKRVFAEINDANNLFLSLMQNSPAIDGYKFIRNMSAENTYIYMLLHLMKHIKVSGAGIRLVLDLWLIKKSDNFNYKAAENLADKFGISGFMKQIEKLAHMWFGNEIFDADFVPAEEYFFTYGIYGNYVNTLIYSVDIRAEKSHFPFAEKFWFVFCTYLNDGVRYKNFPVLKKHPSLLPACCVVSFFKAIINQKKTKENYRKFLTTNEKRKKILVFLNIT